jgi:hypothetical protein
MPARNSEDDPPPGVQACHRIDVIQQGIDGVSHDDGAVTVVDLQCVEYVFGGICTVQEPREVRGRNPRR